MMSFHENKNDDVNKSLDQLLIPGQQCFAIKHLALWVKFTGDNILKYFFLIFPRKQDLTFYANCLHWRQFAWNVKSSFLGKNISTLSSVEFAHRVVKVKQAVAYILHIWIYFL